MCPWSAPSRVHRRPFRKLTIQMSAATRQKQKQLNGYGVLPHGPDTDPVMKSSPFQDRMPAIRFSPPRTTHRKAKNIPSLIHGRRIQEPSSGQARENVHFMKAASFLYRSTGSMGLLMCSFIPHSRHFSTSSAKASAVIAIIGTVLASSRESERISFVALYPSSTGMRISINITS